MCGTLAGLDKHPCHNGKLDHGRDSTTSSNGVGPRLRALRRSAARRWPSCRVDRDLGEHAVPAGVRAAQPTLELLLPLARAHQVPLDELVDAPATGDPRVRAAPVMRHGRDVHPADPAAGRAAGVQEIIPPTARAEPPSQRTHEGYEWLYVLSGRIRLVLGERDLLLAQGEVAEFDTRTPHWFGNPGPDPAEVLACSGRRASGCTSR